MMCDNSKEKMIKRGVVGVGLPVALLMSLTAGFQTPGYIFRLQNFNFLTFISFLIILTPIFSAAGCLWGLAVYRYKKNRC